MMVTAETILRYLALAAFAVAAVGLWSDRFPRRAALATVTTGATALLAGAVVRWSVTGHPPIFGTWENTTTSAWALAVALLIALVAEPDAGRTTWVRLFAVWPPVTLLFGAFFRSEPLPLTISERSLWVDVHIAFAWLAYALLLASTMRAVGALIEGPDAETDEAIVRGAGLGFVAFTLMLAVGSWYSYELFSEWYQWEIVETFAAATWLGYGVVLHTRLLFGWRGRLLYWPMVAVLPLLVMSFWVWSLWSGTYHFFDINVIRAR